MKIKKFFLNNLARLGLIGISYALMVGIFKLSDLIYDMGAEGNIYKPLESPVFVIILISLIVFFILARKTRSRLWWHIRF